jgi:hypothetical protein
VVAFVANLLSLELELSILVVQNVLVVQMIVYQPMLLVELLVYTLFRQCQTDLLRELYKYLDHQDVQQGFVM